MARPRKSLEPVESKLQIVVYVQPLVLDQEQAAAYICSSLYTIEQLWASGDVRSYMQSCKRVCDIRELDTYVDRRNREPVKRLTDRAKNFAG